MGNYEQLKQAISDVIKTNGNQEITGAIMQNALLSIISTVGGNATFAGIATPDTNPGTPDQNVFWIASKNGTYSNFGGIIVEYEVVILYNKNGTWQKSDSGIQVSLVKKRTITLNGGQTLIYLNIKDYRGEKISVKVTGDFTQYGYFKSDSSYTVLGFTPDVWVTFEVPQDATDLFVYNNEAKGTTNPTMEIRTNFASDVVENTKDIATNTQNIKNISKLGYCYGGSLNINLVNKTFTTTFQYAGIGKKGFKTMNNVSEKAITPRTDGSYAGFWVAFLNWDTVEIEIYMFDSIPTDIENRYIVATGINFTENSVQFSTSNIIPSINGISENILNIKEELGLFNPKKTYTVNGGQSIRFINIEDYRGEKISVKVTGDFTQFGYYKSGSDYTVLGFTPDVWVTFEVPQDATDLFVYNNEAKGTTNPTMEIRTNFASEVSDNTQEIKKIYDLINIDAKGCVFMSLGDSITTESYYIPKLRQILQPSKYYNLAVASATWADRSNTTSYDGNPQFQGDQSQNVLGNQVQKIIDNPEIYNVAPDIIIIAAGTNDGTPSSQEMEWDTIETYFTQNGGTDPVPCTTPTFDDSDTFKEMRKTITGAMRYVCSKLQEMYPKARIYILTPIQGSFNPNKNYNTQIRLKQQHIANVAKHLTLPVIHVGENCGINQDFEYGGYYWKPEWATEQNPKNGRDLIDGLHPNTSGGWKMAKYIARELFNNYVNQNY